MKPIMMLHSETIVGNTHQAIRYINKRGWADYVISLHTTGFNTVAVYRMPAGMVIKAREEVSYLDPTGDFPDDYEERIAMANEFKHSMKEIEDE